MKLRTILVDDEMLSLESLQLQLEAHCPGVEIVAMCKGPREGIEKINALDPDLVFLDIEMPGMNGFEMLRQFPVRDFDVIFITAYEEFAIQAFKVNAQEYLLKPVDVRELVAAVEKVQNRIDQLDSQKKIDILLTRLEGQSSGFGKIAIPSYNGLDFINVQDILYCSGDGSYSSIHTAQGEKFVVSKTMKEMEELLHQSGFFRTHQSYLVNLGCIRQYIRGSGGQLVLQDGSVIQVARARKEALMKVIYKT